MDITFEPENDTYSSGYNAACRNVEKITAFLDDMLTKELEAAGIGEDTAFEEEFMSGFYDYVIDSLTE